MPQFKTSPHGEESRTKAPLARPERLTLTFNYTRLRKIFDKNTIVI
jgi:hypothetical protein